MMTIHLDNLNESELIDLNRKIIERLKFLQQTRAHEVMLEFRIGDRVQFNPKGRETVTGMLTRYNKSTVTVITDDGHHWNVAPGFLKKVPHTSLSNWCAAYHQLRTTTSRSQRSIRSSSPTLDANTQTKVLKGAKTLAHVRPH